MSAQTKPCPKCFHSVIPEKIDWASNLIPNQNAGRQFARGSSADQAGVLFSLGSTLYECFYRKFKCTKCGNEFRAFI